MLNPQVREALETMAWRSSNWLAANLFPGDMLLKNFGVTRHGRVVLYDYDGNLLSDRGELPPHPRAAHPRR